MSKVSAHPDGSPLAASAVDTIAVADWNGPFPAAVRERAIAGLEAGHVLFMPQLDFAMGDAEQQLLAGLAADGGRKNISYDPVSGRAKGTAADGTTTARLATLLEEYSLGARALVTGLMPRYAAGLAFGRTSYRPEEIAGRSQSWRKDDRRLHVDAFPSRPSQGRRILRVFSNVNAEGEPRRWRIGEPFEAHAGRFLQQLRASPPGAATLLSLAGITRGRRSPYDQFMLGLHDASKRDTAYQRDAAATLIDFPPRSSWMVFTDQVPHSAIAGRAAFEQTFSLDPAAMAEPARAPLRVLERLAGRPLL